ncbi:hypothetical protein [Nocardia sp. NPDC056000]|uniref:hypothetical protein n=1 Tax=Nocardia sp. NPDC056000 TaxID=3345674 RepID=UPI0035E32B2F
MQSVLDQLLPGARSWAKPWASSSVMLGVAISPLALIAVILTLTAQDPWAEII